jgi:NAD(P)H-dependent FMN reductase
MPKLHILIASTRPGRKGPAVASWVNQFAKTDGKFDVELVDLASFGLPVFDEPEHPATGKYVNEHTKRWSASVAAADAFIFVVPEYDHHAPSSLINAMQYLYREWNYKPVAFVSYGGQAGGARSGEVTRLFCTGFKLVPLVEGVMLPFFEKQIDGSGVFIADEKIDKAATAMLSELRRWTDALSVMR